MPRVEPEYVNMPCPRCAAETLYLSDNNKELICDTCEAVRPLGQEKSKVKERPLSASAHLIGKDRGLDQKGTEYQCGGCKARLRVFYPIAAFHCPFCGSETYTEQEKPADPVKPVKLIPFTYPRAKALKQYRAWLKNNWLRPPLLSSLAREEHLYPVYLPYFLVKAQSKSSWSALVGFKPKGEGKIRWANGAGYWEHGFDEVVIKATKGGRHDLVEEIYPYFLNELVPYDPEYLKGRMYEVYQMDEKSVLEAGQKTLDSFIAGRVNTKVPGDMNKELKITSNYDGRFFGHILLPAWIGGYRYKGTIYQFLINGQTGEVVGEKPFSTQRIIAALLVGAGLIWVLVYGVSKFM
ncbi:MAG: hypothetical protein AAGI38_14800 [Bacteroidota bacterium]